MKIKKTIGRFKKMQELLDYKLVGANEMLSKIDRNILENLGK